MSVLSLFRDTLNQPDLINTLGAGVIGDDLPFETPFGIQKLLYADYTASGRALRQVEDFVATEVLPFYANSHTEASFCGRTMTLMREEARSTIARLVNADDACHVIFSGSGATAGLNKITNMLQIKERIAAGQKILVLNSWYEHHSNILPWRESGAHMRTVPEAEGGGMDLISLENILLKEKSADLIIGSFSAASNVTGITVDPDPITRILKKHGALSIWDYAGGGPYLSMDMNPEADCQKDAIVFSPHKFVGGPGASGVAVLRDTLTRSHVPSAPGGGTVSFVSPWGHTYLDRLEAREEAGTPNVIGDIRAALVMLVKEAIGHKTIEERDAVLRAEGVARLAQHPNIRLLGGSVIEGALPIFSFQIVNTSGQMVHHQLVTRMLSDVFGIQARGGCACAGPYAHQLLGLNREDSNALFARIQAGDELAKPGWVRLNLSYIHRPDQVTRILDAVTTLASSVCDYSKRYDADQATARFAVKVA